MSIIQPTNNPSLIIDDFINYATAHLSTVSGIVTTVSLYPPVGTPGPGILLWSGYVVQPDTSAPITERDDDTSIAEGLEVSEYEKSTGTKIVKEQPIPRKPQSSNVSKQINVQKATNASYILPSVTTPSIVIPTSTTPEAIQRLQSGPSSQVYRNIGASAYPKPPGLGSSGNGLLNERILVPIGPNGQRRYGGQFLLHPEAADSFFKLKQQAKEDGIGFTITSAYRNVEHQGGLGAGAGVAGAGRSPHGWGGAIDFGELYRAVGGSTSPVKNRQAREVSPLYRWLSINGPKYGWYNPYRLADGAGVDEIWHWEYWGFSI
jgi:LAS superfamily LD-carboxypeptidase LdcB